MYLNDMNNLKKYLITRTDEFQDFNLVLGKNRLSKIENNNSDQITFIPNGLPILYIELTNRKNKIKDYIIKNILREDDPKYICIPDINGKYFICNDDLYIKKTKQFSTEVNDIISSEFVKNLNYSTVKIYNNSTFNLKLDFISINISKFINKQNYKLVYLPVENKLKVSTNIINDINSEFINNILNTKIPSEMLLSEYQNIIEKDYDENKTDKLEIQKCKTL